MASRFNRLLHGEACEVETELEHGEGLNNLELAAALTNAFRRIDQLEDKVRELDRECLRPGDS